MLLNCLKIIHGYPTTQLGIKITILIQLGLQKCKDVH